MRFHIKNVEDQLQEKVKLVASLQTDLRKIDIQRSFRFTSFFAECCREENSQLEQDAENAQRLIEEATRRFSKFFDLLQISSSDLKISHIVLGGGSYGGLHCNCCCCY